MDKGAAEVSRVPAEAWGARDAVAVPMSVGVTDGRNEFWELLAAGDHDLSLRNFPPLEAACRIRQHQARPDCVVENSIQSAQLRGEGLRGDVPTPLGKPAFAAPCRGIPNGDSTEVRREVMDAYHSPFHATILQCAPGCVQPTPGYILKRHFAGISEREIADLLA